MAAQNILLAVAILLLAKLFMNWYKYCSIPGPLLAGTSDLWRAYYQYRGQLRSKLLTLHKIHGPIVRYGVDAVSISDPSAISIIYGSRAGFVTVSTAESYKVLVGISNGKEVASLVSTADEAKHGALRRSVSKAFTPAAVLDYEVYIDQTIPDLLQALERHETVDLSEMMLLYSMDSATRVSFGETLGCLESESDVGGTIQLIRDRFNHWGWWSSIPTLERLVYRNPYSMRVQRTPSSMAAKAVSLLKSRADTTEDKTHSDLLQKFIQAGHDSPETLDMTGIVGLLMSTISGAGDTTATTMTAWLFNLMKSPEVMRKLRAEIVEAKLSVPPSFAEVNKLPYLNAVLKESMRVYPTPTFPMERKVPSGGVSIAGTFFPEGITVGCMPSAIHMNPTAFGEDAEVFRPERWLEADEDSLRSMESAHLGFSRGRRACLGQHIAVMQMKKVISSLIVTFGVSVLPLGRLICTFYRYEEYFSVSIRTL
ncbi:cytochrome P450 [Mollisia scopiformis]|uniref:Cytochrome P450 n=1 Tax=Mollisia scopiformis TaxID=149040 RepID=A0A132B923_MOLSC|nr:cytochrome P450 [Mollisia scopiformis]KUJ08910.1 cytochrome P450 [Mollisia scopiformis]